MALPAYPATLSISMINTELGRASNSANSSLQQLANLAKTNSTPYINRANPKISHWHGYSHIPAYEYYFFMGSNEGAPTCADHGLFWLTGYSPSSSMAIGIQLYMDANFNSVLPISGGQMWNQGTDELVTFGSTFGQVSGLTSCATPTTYELYWENRNYGVQETNFSIYKNGSLILTDTRASNEVNNGFITIEAGATIVAYGSVTNPGTQVYLGMTAHNDDASYDVDTDGGNAYENYSGQVMFSMDYNASIISEGTY